MSTLIGLDLGHKRVGLALSDEMRTLATPLDVIPFIGRQKLLDELTRIAKIYSADTFIVGNPITLKGEQGIASEKITAHVEWFKIHSNFKWILWDERLSTAEVERMLIDSDVSREKRRAVRDKLAAQRILQSYLDFQKASA